MSKSGIRTTPSSPLSLSPKATLSIKNSLLLTSAALVLAATLTGIGTALLASDPQTIARLTTVASILGVGSIGMFFVGLVYPRS